MPSHPRAAPHAQRPSEAGSVLGTPATASAGLITPAPAATRVVGKDWPRAADQVEGPDWLAFLR